MMSKVEKILRGSAKSWLLLSEALVHYGEFKLDRARAAKKKEAMNLLLWVLQSCWPRTMMSRV
jgi:hypothetical protein